LAVSAISPRYLKKTDKTIPLVVKSVLSNFDVAQVGTSIYGTPATLAVTGSTNADAGLTYSYDFNNNGLFNDAGDIQDSFSTSASYSFPNPGLFKVRVRIKDNLNQFQDYFSSVKVMPTATSAATVSFSSIAGIYMSQQVAVYLDPNLNGVASDAGSMINWGDGTTSQGSLALQTNGSYAVYGSHKYAAPGNFIVNVQVKDLYGAVASAAAQTIIVRPAISVSANAILMTAGSSLGGKVGSFAPVAGVNPLGAVINWGDGDSSDGLIASNNAGGFDISAQHTYKAGGNYVPVVGLVNQGVSVAAGGTAADRFTADSVFSGGSTALTYDNITIQGIINPAPESVYKTSRVGNSFSYTFNNLAPGAAYAVRLHFADPNSRGIGQRVFNVSLNGDSILNNFDIYFAQS
jgi:hypothetical protein